MGVTQVRIQRYQDQNDDQSDQEPIEEGTVKESEMANLPLPLTGDEKTNNT